MNKENTLNLYLISQTVNNDYDTFDSAVVAARDEEDARSIHPIFVHWPDSFYQPTVTQTAREAEEEEEENGYFDDSTWTTRENVEVRFLGIGSTDIKRGVVCASYNAG